MMPMGSRSGKNRTNADATRATVWLWLTAPIAVLVVVATGTELLFDVFRGDEPYLVAQAIGQDYVTLAVATVKVWRPVSRGEGRLEDRPERVAYETAGATRKRRCPRSVCRLRARGGARCPHRRGRPRS